MPEKRKFREEYRCEINPTKARSFDNLQEALQVFDDDEKYERLVFVILEITEGTVERIVHLSEIKARISESD